MGIKFYSKILTIISITIFTLLSFSCGEIIGFSDFPEPELENIMKIYIYLSDNSLRELYDSTHEDTWAKCNYKQGSIRTSAYIKVRGYTSKLYPKKSFTLKFKENDREKRYALDSTGAPWIKNRIVMYTYQQIGLPSPDSTGAALFINDSYIGCYAVVDI